MKKVFAMLRVLVEVREALDKDVVPEGLGCLFGMMYDMASSPCSLLVQHQLLFQRSLVFCLIVY